MDAAANEARGGVSWEAFWQELKPGEAFDKGAALPELVAALASDALPRGPRALVPGCGRGYDVEALVQSGRYDAVVGLDLSATAVEQANLYLAARALRGQYAVLAADFFDPAALHPAFDLVYDCTFFCALPVDWRPRWAARMRHLIKVGGVLVTMMYPMGKPREEGGPPHGVSERDYRDLLEGDGGFVPRDGPRVIDDERAHPGRGTGKSYWCVWERVDV